MKHNKKTLALANEYIATMEACAAYLTVNQPSISSPEAAYRLLRPLMTAASGGDKQETFFVLLLNTKFKSIGLPVECFRGLLDSCPIHARELLREAVKHSAHSILLAHNHPSGDPTPSKEDIDITRRIIEAADILGIRVNDHIVIGLPSENSPGYVSLRERGRVTFK
jgi:DNA repair protein RadC